MPMDQNQPMTREQVKKEKAEQRENEAIIKIKRRKRKFPIWLRVLIVLFLIVVCFFGGLVVGYGVVGHGKPMDALKESTYTHIRDIVIKEK